MSSDMTVEELLEEAENAIHEQDTERALRLARQARAMAPMRPDVRERVAFLLEQVEAPPEAPSRRLSRRVIQPTIEEAPRPSRRQRRSAERAFANARIDEEDSSSDEDSPLPPRRFSFASLGARTLSFLMGDDEDADGEVPEEPKPRRAPRETRKAPVATPSRRSQVTPSRGYEPEEEPIYQRQVTQTAAAPDEETPEAVSLPRSQRFEPPQPSPFVTRLRQNAQQSSLANRLADMDEETTDESPQRVRRRPPPEFEDRPSAATITRRRSAPIYEDITLSDDGDNTSETSPPLQVAMASRLRSVPPRVVAWSMLLSSISIFMMIAGTVSYVQFFRPMSSTGSRFTAAATSSTAGINAEDENHILRANEFITADKWDSAIELLAPSVRSDAPKALRERATALLALAHNRKGEALLRNTAGSKLAMPAEQQKLLDSVSNYRRAVELTPSNSQYQLHLGNALYYAGTLMPPEKGSGYLEEALSVVKKSIELDPKDPLAAETLAQVYESMQDRDQAREAWMRFQEIAPTKDDAQKATERLNALSMAK